MRFKATVLTEIVYIRVYRGLNDLPRGLYRIAGQDRGQCLIVLQRVDGLPFRQCLTTHCFELMLANKWLDLSLTTTRL